LPIASVADAASSTRKPRSEAARRLDPHNQARYAYLEGFARFGLEQFDAAAQLLERALELGPDLWPPESPYRGADCDPCELLLAAYGHLGGRDADIQAMRDRLSGTWNPYMMVVRTIVAFRPFKEPGDASGLPKACAVPDCRNTSPSDDPPPARFGAGGVDEPERHHERRSAYRPS